MLLAACGGATGSAPASSQEIQITLSDFKIVSSVPTLTPGTPYHFVVKNAGKTSHEFMIMPMGMNMSGSSMEDMHKQALAMLDTVNPGETRTVDYTFDQSMSGKQFEFACHFPGHYEAGMKLGISVT